VLGLGDADTMDKFPPSTVHVTFAALMELFLKYRMETTFYYTSPPPTD
jgi:hypothetical protein